MKKQYVLLTAICLLNVSVWACDAVLRPFPADCQIQDRFVSIRNKFKQKGQDINEIAEYRVLRFTEEAKFEQAISYRVAPKNIYQPAPATWMVWDGGIRELFAGNLKGLLFGGTTLTKQNLSAINRRLLTDGRISVKDQITDQSKRPGEFRSSRDNPVGYCSNNPRNDQYLIEASKQSIIQFQTWWENKNGISFRDVVKQYGGIQPNKATMVTNMRFDGDYCSTGAYFIEYAPSSDVDKNLSWLQTFIDYNLDQYKKGTATLSPIQLAAFVQKWFVTIHPFADGNGRTSRAIQDYILANFDLPFISSGKLQNDATATVPDYFKATYTAMEDTLTSLDSCASDLNYQDVQEVLANYQCAPVNFLNQNL